MRGELQPVGSGGSFVATEIDAIDKFPFPENSVNFLGIEPYEFLGNFSRYTTLRCDFGHRRVFGALTLPDNDSPLVCKISPLSQLLWLRTLIRSVSVARIVARVSTN